MIIVRTPYRVSFLGGGSDLPAFCEQMPGMAISTTINKYMYILVHPCFDSTETKVKYSQIEAVKDVDTLSHPIVRAVLKKLNVQGIEVSSVGDIPASTGLGSSSSFTVGLLQAIYKHLGQDRTKEQLAAEASNVEINILHEPIGRQDQYAAAYGGFNQFTFNADGSVDTLPVTIPSDGLKTLEKSLIMFFTGTTRSASKVLAEQSKNLATDEDKTKALQKMVSMVPDLRKELEAGNHESLGEYLHQGWLIKRELAAAITNPELDEIYDKARRLGALGGKLLGAGGGGFFLFYCPEEKQDQLVKGLGGLKYMPVGFDTDGSQVVYVA